MTYMPDVREDAPAPSPSPRRIPGRGVNLGGADAERGWTSMSWAAAAAAGWIGADLTPWVAEARLGILGLGAVGLTRLFQEHQARRHEEVLEVLTRALSPLIGAHPEAEVAAHGWSRGKESTPERLMITYDPRAPWRSGKTATTTGAAAKNAPEWTDRILEVVSGYLERPVTLDSHDIRGCRIAMQIHPPAPAIEEEPVPELAARARGIIDGLLGADAKMEATWDETRLVALDISHNLGVRISPNPRARAHIERTVGMMLPGRWRARWDLEHDLVHLEVRPEIPDSLERDLSTVPEDMRRRLPYAVDEDGRLAWWDLASSAATPHFLMTGSTGTGKTASIRGIVLEACRRCFQVRIADPKRVEFVGLKGWPNVEIVATSVPQIVAVIHQTWLEMERRYQLIESGKATSKDFEPLLLVLDEYRYFYGIVNAWYASVKGPGGSRVCPILEEVFLIASLGRTADVHVLLGTQRPDAEWLGGDVRDQFQARMSMGRLSPQGAQMMWDSAQWGTSVPRGKPGRGTTVTPGGEIVEAQTFWTPDPMSASPAELEILAALKPATITWPRHVVVPLPTEDEDGEPIEEKGRYTAWRDAPYVLASERPDLQHYIPDALAPREGDEPSSARESVAYAGGELDDAIAQDDYDDYGPQVNLRVGQLHDKIGSLLQIDDHFDLWAVIETVDEDVIDPDQIAVCWRSDQDGDDYGVLVMSASEFVAVRHPRDESEDQE